MVKRNQRSFIGILGVMMLLLSIFSVTLATENLGTESGEDTNIQYIDNYDDYDEMLNDIDSSATYGQDDIKNYFNEYESIIQEYYKEYRSPEVYKARVIVAKEPMEYYDVDEYYYSVAKCEIQPLIVEILEGEHIGEEYKINYQIRTTTVDMTTGAYVGSVKTATLKAGDTVFVSIFTDEETGEVYADINNKVSATERLGVMVCIAIIVVLVVALYGGKKGVLAMLIGILLLDFCLVIFPNMIFEQQNYSLVTVIAAITLIAMICIVKLGISKKAFKTGVLSAAITAIGVILLFVGNYLTRTTGITFETMFLSENALISYIDFQAVYNLITTIIMAVMVSLVACKVAIQLEKSNSCDFNENLNGCKGVLFEAIIMVTTILFALYIPNQLLLVSNKYTASEVWNSEVMINELIRLFILILMAALTIPTMIVCNHKDTKEIENKKEDDKKA